MSMVFASECDGQLKIEANEISMQQTKYIDEKKNEKVYWFVAARWKNKINDNMAFI